jgi:hypothetical protein
VRPAPWTIATLSRSASATARGSPSSPATVLSVGIAASTSSRSEGAAPQAAAHSSAATVM